MAAYYNEIDPFAAAWLRELIKAGHIAPGEVDTRSIADVMPSDLAGFTQCHFFSGIGVWSYALRQAGWPDERPVWTGSCPCQPFSSAGKGKGFKDERHLWPEFYRLISQCRPPICFGEQVASKDGLAWIELVQANMESAGYAFGAVDFCSASIGAPHIRQRLYWVGADTLGDASLRGCLRGEVGNEAGQQCTTLGSREDEGCWGHDVADDGACVRLAHANDTRSQGRHGVHQCAIKCTAGESRVVGGLANSESAECKGRGDTRPRGNGFANDCQACRPSPVNGHWRDADWLLCRDGKWRAVEPGTFPLAHGAAARVGRLRGYGNAINAIAAQTFIEAFMEVQNG